MKANELPEKYKTCDWMWNYGSIGLTKDHIKRLNNAISILESLNEHTDAKYLKEIKDKLLKDIPKTEKFNADAFIEKACAFIRERIIFDDNAWYVEGEVTLKDKVIEEFRNYMKGE